MPASCHEPTFRGTGGYGILDRVTASVCLDVGRPDHLAPLLGVVGDELAEIGGRSRQCHAAEVSEPRFHLGVGEGRVDLLVELLDDFGRRIPRCADAPKGACLTVRYEIA